MQFSPVNTTERAKIDIRSGDTVRVWQKIQEKGKTRLQAFEGLVVARKHGAEPGAMFTVRKIASGVGVERTFPLYSPNIEKIEIVRRAKVRRSKIYYIREKTAKNIRRKMKGLRGFVPVSFDEREVAAPEESEKEAVSEESTNENEEVQEEKQAQEEEKSGPEPTDTPAEYPEKEPEKTNAQ